MVGSSIMLDPELEGWSSGGEPVHGRGHCYLPNTTIILLHTATFTTRYALLGNNNFKFGQCCVGVLQTVLLYDGSLLPCYSATKVHNMKRTKSLSMKSITDMTQCHSRVILTG